MALTTGKKWLIAGSAVLGTLAITVGTTVFWVQSSVQERLQAHYPAPKSLELATEIAQADVELGKRIVTVRNGCTDCHGAQLQGAVVMDNPAMGFIYAPNLTPAHLGDWSDDEIGRAIRHGIGKQGQALILMPSHDYLPLSKSDLAAMIAYLRDLPATEQPNPSSRLGPVAHALVAFEKAPSLIPAQIIDHNQGFATKPLEAPTAEFGRYLAQSACAGCHNPQFTGGPIPGGPPDWPPAADLNRIKNWKESDFNHVLTTGVRPDGIQLQAPMPVMKALNATELKALWEYLRQLG
ncbi:MAG: c-type cytochrome [Candidatus Sericytochromatia bacterium]